VGRPCHQHRPPHPPGSLLDDFFAPGGGSFTPSLWPRANLEAMDWENLLALIAALALVGYLVYSLVHPERF
jgi:K+-transporting ATPase KdpF subunit